MSCVGHTGGARSDDEKLHESQAASHANEASGRRRADKVREANRQRDQDLGDLLQGRDLPPEHSARRLAVMMAVRCKAPVARGSNRFARER